MFKGNDMNASIFSTIFSVSTHLPFLIFTCFTALRFSLVSFMLLFNSQVECMLIDEHTTHKNWEEGFESSCHWRESSLANIMTKSPTKCLPSRPINGDTYIVNMWLWISTLNQYLNYTILLHYPPTDNYNVYLYSIWIYFLNKSDNQIL